MNQAHFHLMLVHIPVVLVPIALVLYLIGYRWRSRPLRLVALCAFTLAAAFAGVAFVLGEGAEEIVEDIAGVAESAIEAHEESAAVALWLTIGLGITSLVKLLSLRFKVETAKFLVLPIILLGVVSSAALAYTAQEGGKIRHPEAFGQNAPGTNSNRPNHGDD